MKLSAGGVLLAALLMGMPLISSAVTSLGTGTGALVGGDITDPENDIDDTVPGGANFNWITATATSEPDFSPGGPTNEAAFDIFDNQVGSGSTKWCCTDAPQNVAVQFALPYILTSFTIAAGNDVVGRDPTVWFIEGSNDGATWIPIFSYNNPGVTPFSARLEVLRYDGAGVDFATPPEYRFFRYRVDQTNGAGAHQINEIELFGTPIVPQIPSTNWLGQLLMVSLITMLGAFALRRRVAPRRNI